VSSRTERAILRFTGTPIHTSFTTIVEPPLLNHAESRIPAPTYAPLLWCHPRCEHRFARRLRRGMAVGFGL